ncbi:hypothetical protein EVC30_112 [Rhizobium phage RHph_Y1_11]|nr:hypothetical protein EVC30_112 [Rhizobium phage RHph_Y1_11]
MPSRFQPNIFRSAKKAEIAIVGAGLEAFEHTVTKTVDGLMQTLYQPVFTAKTLDEVKLFSSKGFACAYDPPRPVYECHKVAFLSTAHIAMLTSSMQMMGDDGWVSPQGHGFMLRVRLETDEAFSRFPVDIQNVFRYLAKEDVSYVVFDRDVVPIEELPVYPW